MKSRRFQIKSLEGDTLYTMIPIDHGELRKLCVPRPLQALEIGEGAWCLGHANVKLYVERVK